MNPSANRLLKILTGKNYNGIIGRAEISRSSSISEGTLLHSDSSITLICFWTFLEMCCHLVSYTCPATAVTASGFSCDLYWVMVGYKLVHAWELPRNCSHPLITLLIRVTGRQKPVKNKYVDFEQNRYLENIIRPAQNMRAHKINWESLKLKLTAPKGSDSSAMGKDSGGFELQAGTQKRDKAQQRVPERADQEDGMRGSGKTSAKAKAESCPMTGSAAAGLQNL